jgi:HEAT repeat protein
VEFPGREECLKKVQESARDPDPFVREAAAIALGIKKYASAFVHANVNARTHAKRYASSRAHCAYRTHKYAHKHKFKHSRAHTGELAKGSDRESLHALIELKFDPVPRVVEAVVASISKIVAGRAQDNGTLASFVGISPAANSRHAAHPKIAAIYMCMHAHMHTILMNTCAVMFVHTQIDAYKRVCTHTQAFAIGN